MTTPTNDPTAELAERVARKLFGEHPKTPYSDGFLAERAALIAAELRPLVEALEKIAGYGCLCRTVSEPGPCDSCLANTALAAARSGKEGGL